MALSLSSAAVAFTAPVLPAVRPAVAPADVRMETVKDLEDLAVKLKAQPCGGAW